jgi:hypothetical protein
VAPSVIVYVIAICFPHHSTPSITAQRASVVGDKGEYPFFYPAAVLERVGIYKRGYVGEVEGSIDNNAAAVFSSPCSRKIFRATKQCYVVVNLDFLLFVLPVPC